MQLHSDFWDEFTSLRIPLLIGATFTTVVWYWIALRFVQPVLASCATLACLVWSFPNYFAALPSWYILMLASWALWALLKFHESKARRYLLLAGVLSGLSLLFKIVDLPCGSLAICYLDRSIDLPFR